MEINVIFTHRLSSRTSQPSSADSRASQQDLRRLLALLSSRDQQLRQPPADWPRLLGWAERLLSKQRQIKLSSQVSSQTQQPTPAGAQSFGASFGHQTTGRLVWFGHGCGKLSANSILCLNSSCQFSCLIMW